MKSDCCVVETSAFPVATVVLLHGYAMQPEDLEPFVHSIGVAARFVLPRGLVPVKPSGRGWWAVDGPARSAALAAGPRDLAFTKPDGRLDARTWLADLLRYERELAGSRPCVLAGFSQGGMLACDTLLHEDVEVDALALLSSSCIDLEAWQSRQARLSGLKTLIAHGRHDEDLVFAAGERLRDLFRCAGAEVTWLPFDGGHQIPLPVWRAVRRLLKSMNASDSHVLTTP